MIIRVELPFHLRTLAGLSTRECEVDVSAAPTIATLLDALEGKYPVLGGTIREHTSRNRRAFLRFFANQQDLSFDPPDTPLPPSVLSGREPFIILGAVAGG